MYTSEKDPGTRLGTQGKDGQCNEFAQYYMKISDQMLTHASTEEERRELASYMHAACFVHEEGDDVKRMEKDKLVIWITSLWDSGALHSSYVTARELEKHPNAIVEDTEVACTLGDTSTVLQITQRAWLTVTFRAGEQELTFSSWFLVLPIHNGPGIIVGLTEIATQGSKFFLEMIFQAVKAAKLSNIRPAVQHSKKSARKAPNDHMSRFNTMMRQRQTSNKAIANKTIAENCYEDIFQKQLQDKHLSGDTTVPIRYMSMSSVKYYYNVGSGEPVVDDADLGTAEPQSNEPAFPANYAVHLNSIYAQYSKLSVNNALGTDPEVHLPPKNVDEDTEARPIVTDETLMTSPAHPEPQPFFDANPEGLHHPWSTIDDPGPEDRNSDSPGLYTNVLYNMEDVGTETQAYLNALDPPPPLPGEAEPKLHIADAMRKVPGFMDYMKKTAVKTFVPHNWDGIRCTPVDFLWKPDMPTVHSTKHRPINPHRFKLVETEFKRLCKYHLTDCRSPITSPITDADKAGPPYVRLCGDYRWINTMILHENAYIPNVKNELTKLSQHKFYIDLDMTNSFHQFKLGAETSHKLALSTPWGIYRPKFMPEGVSPASGVLQQTMAEIFSDFPWATIIFDNFCIGGDTHEQLFERFQIFIDRCQEYNVHLKFAKSFFGFDTIKFFGYKVTGQGWSMDVDRIQAMNDTPFPDGYTPVIKRKQMMSFLGFALYFHEHVPNYSTLAAPFYDMTKADFDWDPTTWDRPYVNLFKEFKAHLSHTLTLYFPDYSLPWTLQTDASQLGCGAILFQIRTDGEGKETREPIGCYSHKFSGPATRWAVIKQEGYAVYASVKHFEYYLRHKSFIIETDHSNLLYIEKSSMAIVQRWRLYLQSFPILAVRHIPGKMNPAADHLSRIFKDDLGTQPGTQVQSNLVAAYTNANPDEPNQFGKGYPCIQGDGPPKKQNPSSTRRKEHRAQLRQDRQDRRTEQLGKQRADSPDLPSISSDELEIDFGHCVEKTYPSDDKAWEAPPENTNRSLYPNTFGARRNNRPAGITVSDYNPDFEDMLTQVHGYEAMHMGQQSTSRQLATLFPGHTVSQEYIRAFIARCPVCQKFRAAADLQRHNPVIKTLKTGGPRKVVGIDFFKMTPSDDDGFTGMHVIVNHFTKYVFIFPSKDNSKESAANALTAYIGIFGIVETIHADQGSDYTSALVETLIKNFGINMKFAIVDRHESNGVEPINREIKRHLQTLIADKRFERNWAQPRVISLIQHHLNNFPSSESGSTAFEMTYGSREGTNAKIMDDFTSQHDDPEYIRLLDGDLRAIHAASLLFQDSLRINRTKSNATQTFWQPGDLVFVDNRDPIHKSQARRLGPYRVLSQSTNNVHIEAMEGSCRFEDVHVDRVSLFEGTEEQARQIAKLDLEQHELTAIVGYRGNPYLRSTMEFELHFADDTYIWKTMVADVTETLAFRDYCMARPELRQLLTTARDAKKLQIQRRKSNIHDRYDVGAEIWVDVRCRQIFNLDWFNANKAHLNPRHTLLVPFIIRERLGPNSNRMRIVPKTDEDHDLEIYKVDGEFMESYAYDPIVENNEYGIPPPWGVLTSDMMKKPLRFRMNETPTDSFGNLTTPFHFDTVQELQKLEDAEERSKLSGFDQLMKIDWASPFGTVIDPRNFWVGDDRDSHNTPLNSLKMCTLEFRTGLEAALDAGLASLLAEVEHDVIVMTECKLSETRKRLVMDKFDASTKYDAIGYNTQAGPVDVVIATHKSTRQHPLLSTEVLFITGLKGRDTTTEALNANQGNAITASFSSIPINILAVSSNTTIARVMDQADELYSGGRSRDRHTILVTSCAQTDKHELPDPYGELADHNYDYNYPIWISRRLFVFSVHTPPKPNVKLTIEDRLFNIDTLMQLRVVEYPQPKVTSRNGWKVKTTKIQSMTHDAAILPQQSVYNDAPKREESDNTLSDGPPHDDPVVRHTVLDDDELAPIQINDDQDLQSDDDDPPPMQFIGGVIHDEAMDLTISPLGHAQMPLRQLRNQMLHDTAQPAVTTQLIAAPRIYGDAAPRIFDDDPPEWPFYQAMVTRSNLLAPLSQYYFIDNDGTMQHANRCLQSYRGIQAGQPIVEPRGNYISAEQANSLVDPYNRYLIMIEDEVLDCYHFAVTAPPECYFSMANTASGLITQQPTMRRLTAEDNNADARIVRYYGTPTVVLYALRYIPPYTEIMWDYRIQASSSTSNDSDAPDDSNNNSTDDDWIDRPHTPFDELPVITTTLEVVLEPVIHRPQVRRVTRTNRAPSIPFTDEIEPTDTPPDQLFQPRRTTRTNRFRPPPTE